MDRGMDSSAALPAGFIAEGRVGIDDLRHRGDTLVAVPVRVRFFVESDHCYLEVSRRTGMRCTVAGLGSGSSRRSCAQSLASLVCRAVATNRSACRNGLFVSAKQFFECGTQALRFFAQAALGCLPAG